MKYPKTMYEATQAAHEARSKAFFAVLHGAAYPLTLMTRLFIGDTQKAKRRHPEPSPHRNCSL